MYIHIYVYAMFNVCMYMYIYIYIYVSSATALHTLVVSHRPPDRVATNGAFTKSNLSLHFTQCCKCTRVATC